ncbi:uridine phosphorylase 1-like isoform X2 [Zerene cesonia]|uniref:uridine phosphorylase 1-like isoform X2 n=1 Tax=Zerene cesonia TaxID=33412 RepID=UPI0018E538BC|nr:uridine phosphorylase 1-like isoform X2 [Zerene cesonia]
MDCTCDYILPTQPNWEQHYENCRVKWNTRENSECQQNNDGTLPLRNAHLLKLDCDILYHMGLDTQTHNLRDMFGDVKHGMGVPSMTIALEELLKILYYAKAKDPIIFRLGTSGGIGVDPGTVVISSSGLSDTLEPCYKLAILGRERKFPCDFDKRLNQELMSVAVDEDFKTVIGVTLCANNFYRGEARTDGAFCDYSDADKQEFLQKLVQLGVTNMEMESTAFAAFTREAGVRSALVCVTFLDRLLGDQVTPDKEVLAEWQQRPAKIVGNYILKYYKK